jgi:hypothetical protein
LHCLRIDRDHLQIGTRGLIWFGSALLPVAQGAERDVEACREFLLRQTEGAAERFGAWSAKAAA